MIPGEGDISYESHRAPRLVPVNPLSIKRGVEAALGSGNPGWEKAIREFAGQSHLNDAMKTMQFFRLGAAAVGDSPWSRTLAEAQTLTHISGSAVYFRCVKEEGRLQKQPVPKIIPEDRSYWMMNLFSEEFFHAIEREDFDNPEPILEAIEKHEANYREFATVQPDFCAMVDDVPWPDDVLTSMKIGAADLYGLLKAHYDRMDMPPLEPDKSSWIK